MSRDLFAIFDAYGFRCGDPDSDCSKARAAVAELIAAAKALAVRYTEFDGDQPCDDQPESVARVWEAIAKVQP